MLKKLLILPLAFSFASCTALTFYPQEEFVEKYADLNKDFNKTLEEPFSNKDLKKMRKKFLFFRRQLTFNNTDFKRIDKSTVDEYTPDINYHLNIIEDLKN